MSVLGRAMFLLLAVVRALTLDVVAVVCIVAV